MIDPKARAARLGHRPALDGLRGYAVIAVMLFHFKTKSVFPGGSLGVDIFFVLSGFLITTLLLEEWRETGSISLRNFYARRALRLLPAVFALLAVYTVISVGLKADAFTGHQKQGHVLAGAIAVLIYLFNWLLANGVSGTLKGMSHLWSLSVEEQFYFIWPMFLLLFLRLHVKPALLILLSIVIIGTSALYPLIDSHVSYLRLYYGTDFRAQELMCGSLFAQLMAAGVLSSQSMKLPLARLAVIGSIAFLIYWLFAMTDRTGFMFNGLYGVTAFAAAWLVFACSNIGSGLPMFIMANPSITHVGKRSYAIYLWHMPLYFWLRGFAPVPQFLLAVLFSFLLAEVSYLLLERPALSLRRHFASTRLPRAAGDPIPPATLNAA